MQPAIPWRVDLARHLRSKDTIFRVLSFDEDIENGAERRSDEVRVADPSKRHRTYRWAFGGSAGPEDRDDPRRRR